MSELAFQFETGVDIVEVDRVKALAERHGMRFQQRVFTQREWDDCAGRATSLAARFAAKEAVLKAIGRREIAYHEIEVERPPMQRPTIRLHGRAARVAAQLGIRQIAVSLSHSRELAIASVVVARSNQAES
jgi:holo-[acyl-carrier protein] synthase